MSKQDYPVQVVATGPEHHRAPPEVVGRGNTIFEPVTSELRRKLSRQVIDASRHFDAHFERWPEVPAVLKITLKEKALAKSHRPTSLLTPRTCPIIGTLDFGEILVSATVDGMRRLSQRITTSNGKKPMANISAIESIEPYRAHDHGSRHVDSSGEGAALKLHTFDHNDGDVNARIALALQELSSELGVEIEKVTYGERRQFYKLPFHAEEVREKLEMFVGLQSLTPMPVYSLTDFEVASSPVGQVDPSLLPPPDPETEYPVVGVVDSGICPNSTVLAPWVVGKEEYVPEELQDNSHGTMVSGLIAGASSLNHGDPRFPAAQAKILDVTVFEKQSKLQEDTLVAILEEVIPKHPEVKIWNLSLGGSAPTSMFEFSDFACFLDEMHDQYGCLFVIASGNHNLVQKWPQTTDTQGADRVSSPGDSIRGLTVGGIASADNAGTLSKEEEPSPFSRRGPGPCFIPKPEVTHYGGNCTQNLSCHQTGILSIGTANQLCETMGTSFATPLVSAQAAALWNYLDNEATPCTPERIKALLIHSALLASDNVTTETVNHHGFGRPRDIIDTLYCDPNVITLMFEADLRHGGYEFERWPFPIADCLRTIEGKFQGEILMTVAYSPITDVRFKSEYCRTNVDVGLGKYEQVLDEEGNAKYEFTGAVPVAPSDINQMYEKHQIENGFKWSPVKAYQAKFPRGKDIDTWRLKMKVTRRAELVMPDRPQRATLLVSLRADRQDQPVYNETMQKLNQLGWVTQNIDEHIRIRI